MHDQPIEGAMSSRSETIDRRLSRLAANGLVIGALLFAGFVITGCGGDEAADETATAEPDESAESDPDDSADEDEDAPAAPTTTEVERTGGGLQHGDCLDLDLEDDSFVQVLFAVPCDDEHNAQVVTTITRADLSGFNADDTCGFRVPRFVRTADLPHTFEVIALSVNRAGDVVYLCTIYNEFGLNGSFVG